MCARCWQLNLKGIAYEIDPITPFFGDEEFARLSPLRRIPVLIDGDFTISDSSVICAYLDEAFPGRPLFPAPRRRARARWLEEFADTRLGDVFIWSLFNQKVVRPRCGAKRPTRSASRRRSSEESRPRSTISKASCRRRLLFGEIGVADIAIASFFRNAAYAGFQVDPARWPRTASFVDAHARPPVHRRPCRSRMSSVAPRSRGDGRRCAMPARR